MHDDVETWSRSHVDANIPSRWEKMAIRPVHVHASDIDNCSGIASTLLQCTFDDALERIEGGSIDLLHLDGLHTYEAVRHDFESWLPKLSSQAVVMFHDINERGGDFGVWRLWAELRERYPAFEFLHGDGLGVLAVGEQPPAPVAALCELADPAAVAMIRVRFARLGERWLTDTRERMRLQEVEGLRLARARKDEAARSEKNAALLRDENARRLTVVERETGATLTRAEREIGVARTRAEQISQGRPGIVITSIERARNMHETNGLQKDPRTSSGPAVMSRLHQGPNT